MNLTLCSRYQKKANGFLLLARHSSDSILCSPYGLLIARNCLRSLWSLNGWVTVEIDFFGEVILNNLKQLLNHQSAGISLFQSLVIIVHGDSEQMTNLVSITDLNLKVDHIDEQHYAWIKSIKFFDNNSSKHQRNTEQGNPQDLHRVVNWTFICNFSWKHFFYWFRTQLITYKSGNRARGLNRS